MRYELHFFIKDGDKFIPSTQKLKNEKELRYFINHAPKGLMICYFDLERVSVHYERGKGLVA